MQLKNLGTIQGIIKSIGRGSTDIQAIMLATEELSVANTAAILTTTGLSEADKIAILMTRGLTEEEAKEILATTTLSTSTGTLAAIQGKAAITTAGFKNALSGLGAVIKANPLLLIVTATTLVIAGLSKIKQSIDETSEELRTKAAESADTLTESLSNLGDYQKKIEDLKDAINSDDISQSEATEKRKQLLEIQEELIKKYGKEKEAVDYITESIQGETTALGNLQTIAAQNYLNNNIKQIEEANNYLTKLNTQNAPLPTTPARVGYNPDAAKYEAYANLVSKQIAPMAELLYTDAGKTTVNGVSFKGTYEEIIAQYDEVLSNIRKYIQEHPITDSSSDEEQWQIEQLREFEKYISGLRNRIDTDEELKRYQKIYDTALESVLLTSNTYSEYYNKLTEAKNKYTEALASGNQDEITQAYTELRDLFNEIFSLDFLDEDNVSGESIKAWFANIQNQVYKQSKETPIIIDIQTELKDSPDGYNNKIKEIAAKNNFTSADIEEIISKGDLTGQTLSADEQSVYDSVKGYVDLWNSVAEATGQSELKVEQYIDILEKLGVVQKEVAEGSESSFALSKDQKKEFKSIFSDVDKLNKAYQDLFSGKLISNDVSELVNLFPTLDEYIDWTDEKFGNLAEGIDKVIRERPTDLIKQLEEILKTENLSDEARKAIESKISALKQLKPELKDTKTLIEDIQKAIKGVSSSISTLIGFTKEISSDGALSLSSIDTIMTDDTYQSLRPYINDMEGMQTAITELVAKQKDAYEDLYNAEMYENDYEAYHKAVQQKEQENENLLSDSVKQIEDEIKYFNDAYGIDITNWDTLTDTKKNILQNTNAELLSKQNQLINEFGQLYKDDVGNFADAIKDKTEIQKHFEESQVYSKINDLIVNDPKSYVGIDRNTGKVLRYASPELQTEINSILSTYGLSYADYANYRDYGKFTDAGNKALEDYLAKLKDKLVNAYTFTDKDWETITANIKSTGGSSSSSSSKNYIDWIERRLKKFARTTKEVFAKVADYISFNNQNSQLRKAINAVHDEITANEKAAQAYMDEANSLGLSSDWINKIQNGDYSIQDISNLSDDLKDKINRYQDLYNKVIDCRNAVDELRKTEKEYANQMLSNVEKYYSNRIDYANQDAEYYNSLDTDNLFMNKNFDAIRKSYNEQISYTQKAHDDLLDTLNSLVSSGSIKYQDDEWYEWWAKIQKCDVEVRNLKKSIHDLASEELQNIQDYWDNRIGVYDNTASYLNAVGGDSTRKGSKDYKGLSSAYNTQIEYTNKQVSELQARLDKAVEDGDIEKYSDKWYKWVGIIEQGKEKAVELQTSVHQLAVEQFEEIQKNYDNELNLYEHTAKEYENKNKEIETRGLLANSKYYSKLQENEKDNISILKKQAKDLENSLNQAVQSGNIEVGSEEWYKMRDAIQSVNEQIDEGNIKVLEYAKTIREIGWEVFDFLQDRISQLATESDFLIDLMSNSKLFDDSGNITAKGKATIGLHTQNYDVYMSQAEQYAEEIREVNAQLMEEPYNTDILKHRDELLGLQKQSILAAGKEKKAIVDLTKQGFDEQLKSLKKLIETYTKSLDAAKSLYDYQKNINEKTSNISKLQKQLNAYQGDNSEETQAKIQQLQTELKEAQEDLQQTEYEKLISDTKSLLDDLYADYEETLNNRLDNVDALVSDMIGVVNDNSGDIKTTIASSAAEVGAILSTEITDIWSGKGAVNGNIVSNYYNGFDTKLTSVQTTLNNISSYVSILAKAGENDVKSTTTDTTKKATTTSTKKSSTPQSTNSTTSTSKVSTPSGTLTGKTNSSINTNSSTNANKSNTSSKGNTNNVNTSSTKTRTDKENYGVALAIIDGNYGWGVGEVRKKNLTDKGFNYNTVQGIVNKLWKEGYVKTGAWKGKYYGISDLSPYAYKKYKVGGLVDYTGIAQVDGTPMKPESFLNADDTQNISNLRDTLRELAAKPITLENGVGVLGTLCGTVTPNILDLSQNLQELSRGYIAHNFNIHNENHIEIGIDKVEDYNDFIMKIQKDRKFENIIQDMTFGRMNGGSSLAKYRH